jgi:hypothetical protein
MYNQDFQGPKVYEVINSDDPDNVYIELTVDSGSIYDFSSYPANVTNALNDVRTNPFLVPSIDIRKKNFDAWEIYTIIINISAIYLMLCKVLFNICKKKDHTLPIKFDIWTQIDLCAAVYSIITFRLVFSTTYDGLDP